MLVHPVRGKHQQPAALRLYPQMEVRERGFAALGNVVEIPHHDQITVADEIDGIEVQLKLLPLPGSVPLDAQLGCQRRIRYAYRQSDIIVVPCQGLVDELAKHSEEMSIRQRSHIQFGPCGLFQARSNAAAVRALESSEPRERLDQAPADGLLQAVVVNAHVMGQCVDGHMAEWNL